jgi:hypothetical protein
MASPVHQGCDALNGPDAILGAGAHPGQRQQPRALPGLLTEAHPGWPYGSSCLGIDRGTVGPSWRP